MQIPDATGGFFTNQHIQYNSTVQWQSMRRTGDREGKKETLLISRPFNKTIIKKAQYSLKLIKAVIISKPADQSTRITSYGNRQGTSVVLLKSSPTSLPITRRQSPNLAYSPQPDTRQN